MAEIEFNVLVCIVFAGSVYNLTALLPNTSYDDYLWYAHSPQFIKLRAEFEVGVSVQLILLITPVIVQSAPLCCLVTPNRPFSRMSTEF